MKIINYMRHFTQLIKFNYSVKTLSHRVRRITTEIPDTTMGLQDKDTHIVWVDLEMTGLDVDNDHILEIACLITNKDLTIIAEGPDLVIHETDTMLDGMDEWCVKHHGESGLTAASRNSKIDVKEAETMVLDFLKQHTPKGKCPIAGNSVGFDRQFITKYMPKLAEHLHYRIIDVSTIKELCRRWYPDDYKVAPAKKLSHRAMDDIRESIEELKFYRCSIFK